MQKVLEKFTGNFKDTYLRTYLRIVLNMAKHWKKVRNWGTSEIWESKENISA